MNTAEFLSRLEGVRSSGDTWVACCPSHDDRNPSLSVRLGEGGRTLVKCHAGCDAGEVVQALGLSLSDLMPERDEPEGKAKIVATYPYRAESGDVLFEVVRLDPKSFRQRRPDGRGDWTWSTKGVRQVLYRLPELLASPERRVFVVEGEKDADRLAALGFIATTNAGGAGKWKACHSDLLRARHVLILPDNDEPGRRHARAVAAALQGIALSVRLVGLPGLPEKGDVSDWLSRGGTAAELKALARSAEEWRPPAVPELDPDGFRPVSMTDLLNGPEEETRWLVDDLLPAGGVSLLVAKPKTGKSTLSLQLAVALARGEPFLGRTTSKGAVVVLSFEEKPSETRRHLREMGVTAEDQIYIHFGSVPEKAIPKLRELVEKYRPVLVIIDTLFRLTGVKDVNDYAQTTAALTPLLDLARDFSSHVMALHHGGKRQGDGVDAPLGSTAIAGSVDTILDLRRRPAYRTLGSIQRYGQDMAETVLAFDPATRTCYLAGTQNEVEEEAAAGNLLKALWDAKEAGKGPLERDALFEEAEGQQAIKVRALRTLVEARKVSRSGEGKKGSPYRYAVPEDSSTPVRATTPVQELEKPKSGENPLQDGSDSCTRDSAPMAVRRAAL